MTQSPIEPLIQHYSSEALIRFLQSKSRDFRPLRQPLPATEDENAAFTNGLLVGEIDFGAAQRFLVCSFEVQRALSERSGKKAQYERAKTALRDTQADAGLFVFSDPEGNFRFSLVYTNFQGTRVKWSNFRRFTYFVSPELTNKTFIQRIGEEDFSSLERIKEAFSVERVTNQFFSEFREVFDRTRTAFEETNKNTVCLYLKSKYDADEYQEQINKFTFTFLGRIIFLYFLLRKGWIENKKDYIRSTIEDRTNKNLYQDVFVPLFFDVFARHPQDRPPEIQAQYQDTPYLNGGLFEHSDLELEMAKANIYILFEDDFIRNMILNFFEIYNFTVDENSPDDQEVSIDPEMLGKVFENTLAEEERGNRGTFYTPREIVHFMVKDALQQFLQEETGIPSSTLKQLVFEDDAGLDLLNPHQIRLIDSKLEGIKVLDPAVGSGAFPVEMMQVLVALRKRLNVRVGRNISEVSLKKELIKNNLYGVDIDSGAIEIAKLRLWLALIVDYDKELVEPLPNLDFQFRVGNSLQEKIGDIDIFQETGDPQLNWLNKQDGVTAIKTQMSEIKDRFYQSNDETMRRKLKEQFDALEHRLIQAVLDKYEMQLMEQSQDQGRRQSAAQIKKTQEKIVSLEQKIQDGTYKLFKPDFHFSEVYERKDQAGERVGGFDIVIGNPPYGVRVTNDIRDWHDLGSTDSYGVFIATALKRFLKTGGVLAFIVSDTWLTIKTHKKLREQVLAQQLHKVIQLHQDCFNAVVNVCMICLTKKPENENHSLVAADLSNLSTRTDVEALRDLLYHLEDHVGESTPIYAVYSYPQALIHTNSSLPIFVGSPKLFQLMQDVDVRTVEKEVGGKRVAVRQIPFNGQLVELVRFGDIADVKVGLQTGENRAYLYQSPSARGSYRDITQFQKYLLTEPMLDVIARDETRRGKIVERGIHKTQQEPNFDPDCWFEGRYIVPYDKGGASDTEAGWLPNYYVPTDYFIDWSTWAVQRMKTLTIAERIENNHENKPIKPNYRTQVAAVFRNTDAYFKKGMTLSYTGKYAPNLRLNSIGVFDVGGSSIFSDFNQYQILGNFVCKITKYLGKTFIDHTVNFQVDENKELPLLTVQSSMIIELVIKIIEKQKVNPRYDYLFNEQKEIDRIVYEMYDLSPEDILEVETWYARRYPRLAHLCDLA